MSMLGQFNPVRPKTRLSAASPRDFVVRIRKYEPDPECMTPGINYWVDKVNGGDVLARDWLVAKNDRLHTNVVSAIKSYRHEYLNI
jgi:hypothetical protein